MQELTKHHLLSSHRNSSIPLHYVQKSSITQTKFTYLLVVSIEQGILLISRSNLFHSLVKLRFVDIELHIGSVVLQILSLEAQVERALDPSSAASDDIGLGER